jgi:hypothetical protein
MAKQQARPSEPEETKAEVRPESDASATRTVEAWAREKGHVPVKRVARFRGDAIHSGKHIRVICAHTQWPLNKLVDEKTYDDAAEAAYSIAIGDDLTAQKARLEAANARAEAAKTNAADKAEGQ